jgi:4-hydroxybenzoate polyprenyltransferase
MADQTYRMIIHAPPDLNFLAFVFFSTICSYNFHWLFTPSSVNPSYRLQWTYTHKNYHLILYFIGLAGSALFFFFLLENWIWLIIAAFITFLYSAPKIPLKGTQLLKKFAIGKTIFLAVVWTYVTTVLPVIISGIELKTDVLLFVASRFFFVYSICILFDYRDREDDKIEGIRSMITYFNEKGINILFVVSLLLFGVTTLWLLKYNYSLTDVIIILIPGLIVAALFNHSKKHFSDYFYYGILDGLMMLSGLVMLLLSI